MLVTGAAAASAPWPRRRGGRRYDVVVNSASSGDLRNVEGVATQARSRGAGVLVHRPTSATRPPVVAMFRADRRRLGRLDVLVNNAGIAGGYGTLEVVDAAMMARLWAVNVTGAFLCAREAVARMSTAHGGPGGSIVNISSKAVVLGGARRVGALRRVEGRDRHDDHRPGEGARHRRACG